MNETIITFNQALIRIKNHYHIDNATLASILKVSTTTISLYCNNKVSVPYKKALLLIDDWLIPNHDDVCNYLFEEDRNYLYHGSRTGINGDIAYDYSKKKLHDFGQGFYLGESLLQSSMLVCDVASDEDRIYKIKLDKTGLNIRTLDATNDKKYLWVLYVAYNRKILNRFNQNGRLDNLIRNTSLIGRRYDAIYGAIADDKLSSTMELFFNNRITDNQLAKCLTLLKIGSQYCLKTKKSCNGLKIEGVYKLDKTMHQIINEYAIKNRDDVNKKRDAIIANKDSTGKLFSEILEELTK